MDFRKEQELPVYYFAENLGFFIAYILFFTIAYFVLLRNMIIFKNVDYIYFILIMIIFRFIYLILKKLSMKDKEKFGRVADLW
jgi:hypothetical protein